MATYKRASPFARLLGDVLAEVVVDCDLNAPIAVSAL